MTVKQDTLKKIAKEVAAEQRQVKWFLLRLFLKRKPAFLTLILLTITLSATLLAPWVAPYPDQGMGAVNLEHR
ncbi:MAG: hypothetical protein DRH26_12895 [Deltaproteobacteria bacterium]|nr:MAG: hypothetical protein DRH26_12895 [Deltaproteobacteria bacterium]